MQCILTCFISTENAAEVADKLASLTELSNEEVSEVAEKVKQLVNVARINKTLAEAVVNIISNVMTSSSQAQAAASEKSVITPPAEELICHFVALFQCL